MWARSVIRASVYFVISKLTLWLLKFFHVSCTILSNVYFRNVILMFSALFDRSQSKAGVINQMIHSCFRKKSIISQLNVEPATAEKEK